MKKILPLLAITLLLSIPTIAQVDTIVTKVPSAKNVVIEEFTGTSCQFCPQGHHIVEQLANTYPGRVLPINIHTGRLAPRYTTSVGDAIANLYSDISFPNATVNRHYFPDGGYVLNRSQYSYAVNNIMQQSSPVNIAAWGTLDYASRQLTLTVQLYYTASSTPTNKLNVAVVQDNVLGPQSGMSSNPEQVVGSQYNHMSMLRYLIAGLDGETITTTAAGSFVQKVFSYVIPETYGSDAVAAVLRDLRFIAFVSEGQYEILTGTEANITGVNLPNVMLQTNSIRSIEGSSCDNQANLCLEVDNLGQNDLTDMTIRYKVDGQSYQFYQWHGLIASQTTGCANIQIPVSPNVSHTITASVTSANNVSVSTLERNVTARITNYFCGGEMQLEIKTDKYGSETTFEMLDPYGSVVLSGGPFPDMQSTSYFFVFHPLITGCYQLKVHDACNDGINNGYGEGYIKLRTSNGQVILSHDGQFQNIVEFNLNVTTPAGIADYDENNGTLRVFPNPVTDKLVLETEEEILLTQVFNMQGQMILQEHGNVHELNVSRLVKGIYSVKIHTSSGFFSQKFEKQ